MNHRPRREGGRQPSLDHEQSDGEDQRRHSRETEKMLVVMPDLLTQGGYRIETEDIRGGQKDGGAYGAPSKSCGRIKGRERNVAMALSTIQSDRPADQEDEQKGGHREKHDFVRLRGDVHAHEVQ